MPQPHRPFGLATAVFVVVSSMVGGGVLTTPGFVVLDVGSHGLNLGLWAVGGLIALAGALTLAELIAAFPRSGGEYVILTEAYGPRVGFVGGWVSLIFGFAAPIAATALAAAQALLGADRAGSGWAVRVIASLLIMGCAAMHSSGRSGAARGQGTITALTLLALIGFVIAGVARSRVSWISALRDAPPPAQWRFGAISAGLVLVSYSYTGWNGAAYLAGEFDNPQRMLPRALVVGTLVVMCVYLATNLVYALALSAREVASLAAHGNRSAVEPIAQIAARRLFGAGVGRAFELGLALVLVGSLSALTLTGPRVAYAMSLAGQFPRFASRLTRSGQAPALATIMLAAAALVMLWTGGFEQIVHSAGFGLAVCSMLTIAAIFVLRVRRPDLHRPFRMPGYPWTPALYLVMTGLFCAGSLVLADPPQRRASVAALACMALGAVFHDLLTRRDLRRKSREP